MVRYNINACLKYRLVEGKIGYNVSKPLVSILRLHSEKTTVMARKTDPQIEENRDRGAENEQGSPGIDSRNNNYNDDEVTNESDTIKNANSSGLGAIGRNDQKQTDFTSNHSGDA